jgi:hypothetical protein
VSDVFAEVDGYCARLEAVVLQQVGVKGHDGLAVIRVR